MSTHDVTIASSVTTADERTDGATLTRISSDRHAGTKVAATVARMQATRSPEELTAHLAERDGQKVTVLKYWHSMLGATLVVASPGTLFNGGTAILPKGKRSNGLRIDTSKVLDVIDGWDTDAAQRSYDSFDVGAWEPLTADTIAGLPEKSATCTLAITTRGLGVSGMLWLCTNYLAEDDIVEGMLVVPSHHELVSEHGSIFGRQLLENDAVVLTAATPISFAEAIQLETLSNAYEAIGL